MGNLINKEVRDFKVQAYHEGKFKEITKKDTLNHWSVFFFYPADFTFVCPTELGDLADYYEEFKKAGCEIYSVSEDTHFAHKAWADSSDTIKRIPYPMLGDPAGVLAKSFGVFLINYLERANELAALRESFISLSLGGLIFPYPGESYLPSFSQGTGKRLYRT